MSKVEPWLLKGGRTFCPAPFCLIGILNITPDSFSDGGAYFSPEQAVTHGCQMLAEGAAMLDVGAESTRPFAEPVPEAEERIRLLPVLTTLRTRCPQAVLCVDTFKAGTAVAALEAGADIINDVSACAFDPGLLDVLVQYKPGYVLMHSQGTPATMQIAPKYDSVIDELLHFFEARLTMLVQAGIPEQAIVLDPGIGFGKNKDHTLTILRNIEKLLLFNRPLYVGLSRKSLFKELLGLDLHQREEATHLAVALLAARGVQYHRVHDVAGCAQALRLVKAITPELIANMVDNPKTLQRNGA